MLTRRLELDLFLLGVAALLIASPVGNALFRLYISWTDRTVVVSPSEHAIFALVLVQLGFFLIFAAALAGIWDRFKSRIIPRLSATARVGIVSFTSAAGILAAIVLVWRIGPSVMLASYSALALVALKWLMEYSLDLPMGPDFLTHHWPCVPRNRPMRNLLGLSAWMYLAFSIVGLFVVQKHPKGIYPLIPLIYMNALLLPFAALYALALRKRNRLARAFDSSE